MKLNMFIDPIHFDYDTSTIKNIDLYVNESMYRNIYNATILLNKSKKPFKSIWYINGKDVKIEKNGYNVLNNNNMLINIIKYKKFRMINFDL